ncbi:MAG: T9SS type A sorting domain-containing protein, partial [Saprospiraceae bacterium]|nr:T9SS type A sorting domain-containing protein [Saprospiraceae bacterium]MCB0684643.1 T9SS type A sorting domain-containing protein [Saprospiraceae bacterium]
LRAGNMQIVDLWGRIVAKEVLPPGQQEYTSSIAALPAGVYFVRVLEDGLPVWSQRVVKH